MRSLLLALMLLAPVSALAQTVTGTLQGTVIDSTGGVLPGVTVTARNQDTGQERVTITNAAGYYVLPFVPVGVYQVNATLQGFRTIQRSEVAVTLNDTRVEDFTLTPAAVAEVVTVIAETAPVNTTSAEIKHALNEQQIEDRPTANRGSFLALAETFAGFSENPTSGQNNPTASSGSSINFNGAGTRGATFQINGVNNDDSSENQNRQGAALATIKEFQVISNSYSAEFGRAYGAVVLVQTKSGTNRWHGEAYEYRQDSTWNARSAFSLTKPDNSQDQFGIVAGFPLAQNRLFGFASADHKRFGGAQTYTRDIFLASERAAPRLTRDNDTPANRAFIESILARFPNATPNDPRSARTFQTQQALNRPADDHSARVDWSPSRTHTVWGRYQYTHQIFESDDVVVGEQARQDNEQGNFGLAWTHVFGDAMVGEARYGLGLRLTRVDIAAGNDTPIVRFTASPVSGSTIGNAGNFPINRDQTDHQFVYNLTRLFGREHQLKSGIDVRFQSLDDISDSFSRGFWTFNASCGGVNYPTPYAAFLDGCVSSFQKAWGPFYLENRMREYNIYVEDSWRLRPNLSLNLGVRYEYVSAPYEAEDRLDYGFTDDRNNLEPRLGVAWSPTWQGGFLRRISGSEAGGFAIRAGYGVYDGRIFQSVFSQTGASMRTNPPNSLSRTFTTQPGILNPADPTLGFEFVPGPQTARHAITIADGELEMPRTQQWNLSVERRIPFNSTVRVSYTGSRGDRLLKYALANLPVSPIVRPVVVADHPNNAPAAGFPDLRGRTIDRIAADVNCAGTGLPGIAVTAQCPNVVPIADNEISFRVPRTNERRPDPRYTTNTVVSNDAESWYDALQIEWTRRFSRGLWFQTSYTWSLAEDTTSEATAVGAGDSNQLGPDSRYARGYGRFHTPHRFAFTSSYRLPFLRDRRDLIGVVLGGWTASTTVRIAHGTPFTVSDTIRDLNFDGFSEGRPILLDPSILGRTIADPATSTSILSPSKFRSAQFGELDDIIGRNTFFGDGIRTVDLALIKSFPVVRAHTFTVRLEAYNAFNRVMYGFPVADLSNVNFGRVQSGATQYQARVLQGGLQYKF